MLASLSTSLKVLAVALAAFLSAATPTATPPAATVVPPTLAIISVPVTDSIALASATPQTFDGWQGTWGSVSVATGTLEIGANASTTGGEAILASSSDWTDYLFTTNFTWDAGQTVTLLARFNESTSTLSCEFTNTGGIYDYLTVNGVRMSLGQGMVQGFSASSSVEASIQVKGDLMQCGLNGAIVPNYISYGLPQSLYSGGIAISTWDPTLNNSKISVRKIDITPL